VSPRRPSADDLVVAPLLGRCSFPPADGPGGGPLTVAVSGGADSLALLALAVATGRPTTAVHVDHGLRPGSASEADLVATTAATWGATFESRSVEVADGPDLEARARAARHAVLPDETLFGHTADDQAETVLLRLLRGTGPAGLAAMRADRHPLLRLRRSETESLCDHLGLAPFEDPSNRDPRFTRNRVRHEVLPLLADVAGRDTVPLLARLAELAGAQADVLDAVALLVDPTDAVALAQLPPALAAAAVRSWWRSTTGLEHPPDAAALGRVVAVASGSAKGCDVVAGWSVRRTAGRLRLVGPDFASRPQADGALRPEADEVAQG